jgi:hypothetical protein
LFILVLCRHFGNISCTRWHRFFIPQVHHYKPSHPWMLLMHD